MEEQSEEVGRRGDSRGGRERGEEACSRSDLGKDHAWWLYAATSWQAVVVSSDLRE